MEKNREELFKDKFNEILAQSDETLLSESLKEHENEKGDFADVFNVNREKQLELKLLWRQALYVKKVRLALEKINNGDFGICEDCGVDIEEKRLIARPTATMCINCKEEAERGEDLIPYELKSHTTGKKLSSQIVASIGEKNGVDADRMNQVISTANEISRQAAGN